MPSPRLHATAAVTATVTDADLASALAIEPGDVLPDVLATTRMLALMELACARLLRPCLAAGEVSVGAGIETTHTAPTPPGATVTATGRYVGREGRKYVFEVIARDEGGEIGRARHKRVIVKRQRLEDAARLRRPPQR